MEIRLLETAKEDLGEGWKFYEKNAAGLGDYFLDCLQADVRSLKLYAGIHETSEGFHRMMAKRFPFAVYYLIENETIDVYAIGLPTGPRMDRQTTRFVANKRLNVSGGSRRN